MAARRSFVQGVDHGAAIALFGLPRLLSCCGLLLALVAALAAAPPDVLLRTLCRRLSPTDHGKSVTATVTIDDMVDKANPLLTSAATVGVRATH